VALRMSAQAARVGSAMSLSFFFSSRRRHTRFSRDWSSDVCSSDLEREGAESRNREAFVEDLRFAFVPGEQWDEMARQRRLGRPRSEERRVGKEGRSRGCPSQSEKN